MFRIQYGHDGKTPQTTPSPNSARLLLAELRHGDYAHAGDQEAIDLVIQKLLKLNPHIKAGTTLDVGSGFGGTLDYLIQQGFKNTEGIDMDASAVAQAVVIQDLAGKPMYPIQESRIAKDLEVAGWTLISAEDLSDRFIAWYAELLEKLSIQEKSPSTRSKAQDLRKLQSTFRYIQNHLQKKQMGAMVIYARKD